MESHAFRAMNTEILFLAEGDPAKAAQGFAQAEALVQRLEARLTRFKATSELSALNRSDGAWFEASSDLFTVLSLAMDCYHSTEGLFNPAVLPALEANGYDRSLDEIHAAGGVAPLQPWRAGPAPADDFAAADLDARGRRVRLPRGMRLDLGGIAKGWIAGQAADRLAGYARACAVDAGGDMVVWGRPDNQPGWPVALEDPFDPARDLTTFWLTEGASATSSVMKRRWRQGESDRHHLIDPRTGLPAEAQWACVTALAPQAAWAEALAKAALIAGPGEAEQLIARHPGAAFMAVDFHGKLWGTKNASILTRFSSNLDKVLNPCEAPYGCQG